MYIRRSERPRVVRRADGSLLTTADLPGDSSVRWVRKRKAVVLDAVAYGLLSAGEVESRYGICALELENWRDERANRPVMPSPACARQDLPKVAVSPDPENTRLSELEHRLFGLLKARSGNIVSRIEILAALYPTGAAPKQKVIDVMMCRVRAKLGLGSTGPETPRIETVWGRGYRYVPEQTNRSS